MKVPAPDTPIFELIKFAASYNAYERFCSEPNRLEEFFASTAREYRETGEISDALGVDFLRAWLFLLFRQDYWSSPGGYGRDDELWRLIVARIAEKTNE
jgi:hypothetical protein